MDTTTTRAFFDELEKIAGADPFSSRTVSALARKHGITPAQATESLYGGDGITSHGHYPHGKGRRAKLRFASEWLAEDAKDFRKQAVEEDNKITKERLQRLARYGLAGAAGMGVGYATGKMVGRPLYGKLRQMGAGPKAAKFLRYAVPTTAGLGAGLALMKGLSSEKLTEKIREGEKDRPTVKPVLPQH